MFQKQFQFPTLTLSATLQNKVGLQGPELVHNIIICLMEISGYPSVEHFLDASTWIAGYLKALV